ncbi:MAG: ECF-type sigma factor [Burkholderiaceae bacterium]
MAVLVEVEQHFRHFLPMGDVTLLIQRAQNGDRGALGDLFAVLYPELRRIAHARLTSNVRNTLLDTTALVHECYLKFSSAERLKPADRAHFIAYSASAMRSIIVDFARARSAERRGSGALHVTLNTELIEGVPAGEDEILQVDEALDELGKLDPRLVQVVEMRYFGGMSDSDIGAVLGVTDRTVRRDWEKARLLLAATLRR